MSSYSWQGWAPGDGDVYDDTSDESYHYWNSDSDTESYPMAKSLQSQDEVPEPPSHPPPTPRPGFAQLATSTGKTPIPPIPPIPTTSGNTSIGPVNDPSSTYSGPPQHDGSGDIIITDEMDINDIEAAIDASSEMALAQADVTTGSNPVQGGNSANVDPDEDVNMNGDPDSLFDGTTAGLFEGTTDLISDLIGDDTLGPADASTPKRFPVQQTQVQQVDTTQVQQSDTALQALAEPDHDWCQLAIMLPPRTFRLPKTGVDEKNLDSTLWLDQQKAGFVYMHTLKPQAPTGRALLVCSRQTGELIVNKNIHAHPLMIDWRWNENYRRWWHSNPDEAKRDYAGTIPPEIKFARLDDPLVKRRLPEEGVYPNLFGFGISNGRGGVEYDSAFRRPLYVDEYSLYFKHFNGYNLRSILAYATQGPKTAQLWIDEYFIWHVMEQLTSAVIYMQTGITRSELKAGDTRKKENWKPFVHRNILPEHVYLHFEEAWERGQSEFDVNKRDEDPAEKGNYVNESLRRAFPRVVLGSWSQASELHSSEKVYKYNRGERSQIMARLGNKDVDDHTGLRPELWEDIYLLGAVLRRLVTVWDARKREEEWEKSWIDYNVDAGEYTIENVRTPGGNKPHYSEDLYDILELFQVRSKRIQIQDRASWADERYWTPKRLQTKSFVDVDILIDVVFPIARLKVQNEKAKFRANEETGYISIPDTLMHGWYALTNRIDLIPYTPEGQDMEEVKGTKVASRELQLVHGTKYLVWYQFHAPVTSELNPGITDWLAVPWAKQAMEQPAKLWGEYWNQHYSDEIRAANMDTPERGGRHRIGDNHMDDSLVTVDESLTGERRIALEKHKRKGGFKPDWRVQRPVFEAPRGDAAESDADEYEGYEARKDARVQEWDELIEAANPRDPFLALTLEQHLKRVLRWMRRAKRVLWHLYPVALQYDDSAEVRNEEEKLAKDYLEIMRKEVELQATGREVEETPEQRAIKQKYHAMLERLDPKGEYKVGFAHKFAAPREPTPPPPRPPPPPPERQPTRSQGTQGDPSPLPPSPTTKYKREDEARTINNDILATQHRLLRDRLKKVVDQYTEAQHKRDRLETDDHESEQYQRFVEASEEVKELEEKMNLLKKADDNLPKPEQLDRQKERLQKEIKMFRRRAAEFKRAAKEQMTLRNEKTDDAADMMQEAATLRLEALEEADPSRAGQLEDRADELDEEAEALIKEMLPLKTKQSELADRVRLLELKIKGHTEVIAKIDKTLKKQQEPAGGPSYFAQGYEEAMADEGGAGPNRNDGANDSDDGDDGGDGGGGGGPGRTFDGVNDSDEDDNDGGGDNNNDNKPDTATDPEPTPQRRTTRSGRVVRPVSLYSPTNNYNATQQDSQTPRKKPPPKSPPGNTTIPRIPTPPPQTGQKRPRSDPDTAVIRETPPKNPRVGVADKVEIVEVPQSPDKKPPWVNPRIEIPWTQQETVPATQYSSEGGDEVIPATQQPEGSSEKKKRKTRRTKVPSPIVTKEKKGKARKVSTPTKPKSSPGKVPEAPKKTKKTPGKRELEQQVTPTPKRRAVGRPRRYE